MNRSDLPAQQPERDEEIGPGRLAEATARAVRTASPVALAQLLRSPARRVVLDAIFWHAARQLARSRTADLDAIVRCYVTRDGGSGNCEPDVYELRFRSGSCRMARGEGKTKPGLTLALEDAELVRLITGQSTAAQGVFNGRIMVRGDVGRMAATLAAAFASRPPAQPPE